MSISASRASGHEDDPLVLLVGGTAMPSWPDALCERLASGGQRVVRDDLRDSGASTSLHPENPAYDLRDLVADAAALVGVLGSGSAHLGGVGVGGMVTQVAALGHPDAFSALGRWRRARSTRTCRTTTRRS